MTIVRGGIVRRSMTAAARIATAVAVIATTGQWARQEI